MPRARYRGGHDAHRRSSALVLVAVACRGDGRWRRNAVASRPHAARVQRASRPRSRAWLQPRSRRGARDFRAGLAADPRDRGGHRLAAATLWIKTLIAQGAVTAEDFLGQAGTSLRTPPRAEELEAAIGRASRSRRRARLGSRRTPSDEASALFETGAAFSLLASYTATVGGGVQKSLAAGAPAPIAITSACWRSTRRRTDAGLVVGMYRYAVSVLPLWSRLARADRRVRRRARAGVCSSSSRPPAHPGDAQTNARFALIVIYNREARYDDALRVIGELQQQYPRNRLLWLEAGSYRARAGRFDRGPRSRSSTGWRCWPPIARPRAFGELARWRYHLGVAQARLGQRGGTPSVSSTLRSTATAVDWVRGRTYLELRHARRSRRRPRCAPWMPTGRRRGSVRPVKDESCRRDATARLRKAGADESRTVAVASHSCDWARRWPCSRCSWRVAARVPGGRAHVRGHARGAARRVRRPTSRVSCIAGIATTPGPRRRASDALFDFVYQTYDSSAWIPQSLFDSNLAHAGGRRRRRRPSSATRSAWCPGARTRRGPAFGMAPSAPRGHAGSSGRSTASSATRRRSTAWRISAPAPRRSTTSGSARRSRRLTSRRGRLLLPPRLGAIDAQAADANRILNAHHHDKIDSLTRGALDRVRRVARRALHAAAQRRDAGASTRSAAAT